MKLTRFIPMAVLFLTALCLAFFAAQSARASVIGGGDLPTDKNQCKNGGWVTFEVFKNQGDCVSFVATGGKNPPALQ
jgi:hypothetical protein